MAALELPVAMSQEVEQECCGWRDSLDAKLIARAVTEGRIKVRTVKQRTLCDELRREFPLGSGEASAIALALASEGSAVATDDRQAINACKVLRIPFVTALAVLVRMREKGMLSVEEAQRKLEDLVKYGRYKSHIIAAARIELERE